MSHGLNRFSNISLLFVGGALAINCAIELITPPNDPPPKDQVLVSTVPIHEGEVITTEHLREATVEPGSNADAFRTLSFIETVNLVAAREIPANQIIRVPDVRLPEDEESSEVLLHNGPIADASRARITIDATQAN